jgi:tetratricopeptide (TPR) repeat protein
LRQQHRRRLQVLEQQSAQHGINVRPEVPIEIEDLRTAIEFYEQRLVIAREIGDLRGEANALYCIGLALDLLGQCAEAIAQAEAVLAIYEQIESAWAVRVRQMLAEWRAAAAKPARKPRKRRGDR